MKIHVTLCKNVIENVTWKDCCRVKKGSDWKNKSNFAKLLERCYTKDELGKN